MSHIPWIKAFTNVENLYMNPSRSVGPSHHTLLLHFQEHGAKPTPEKPALISYLPQSWPAPQTKTPCPNHKYLLLSTLHDDQFSPFFLAGSNRVMPALL